MKSYFLCRNFPPQETSFVFIVRKKKTFSTFRIPSNPIVAMCFVCEKSGRQGEKTQSKNIFNTNIGRWQKVLYIYFRTSEQFPVNCFSSLNMFSHYLFGLHTFFFLCSHFFCCFFDFFFKSFCFGIRFPFIIIASNRSDLFVTSNYELTKKSQTVLCGFYDVPKMIIFQFSTRKFLVALSTKQASACWPVFDFLLFFPKKKQEQKKKRRHSVSPSQFVFVHVRLII